MSKKRKKTMSREEAAQLYDNLQSAMNKWLAGKKGGKAVAMPKPPAGSGPKLKVDAAELAAVISKGLSRGEAEMELPRRGPSMAVMFVICCAALKLGFSILEATGFAGVKPAQATMLQQPVAAVSVDAGGYSREERQVLTALDARRAALDDRNRKLDDRERDLEKRDREFAARLTEIRDLTGRLKVDRDKNEKRQSDQMTQLSKVYSSMNPKEAAQLIEQLDVTIALSLLERMSEKRIAEILATMSPDRALMLTKMLSGGK